MGFFDIFNKKEKEELYKDEPTYDINDISSFDLSNNKPKQDKSIEEEKENFEYDVNDIDLSSPNLSSEVQITEKKPSLEDTFKSKYGLITNFKTALKYMEENGIKTKFSQDAIEVYEDLKSTLLDPEKFRRELFYPYYLEKEQYDCLDPNEKAELESIKQSIPKEELLQSFKLSLAYYQSMGINDISDESKFDKSFSKYFNLEGNNSKNIRDQIMNMSDMITTGLNNKKSHSSDGMTL